VLQGFSSRVSANSQGAIDAATTAVLALCGAAASFGFGTLLYRFRCAY
jgi:hypothetical protein